MSWQYAAIVLRGYLISILIETPVLLVGLCRVHSWRQRLFAGVWLTACTYPLLALVLPVLIDPERSRFQYLLIGETLVPIAECFLFWLAFHFRRNVPRGCMLRDFITIIVANLASFGIGELLQG